MCNQCSFQVALRSLRFKQPIHHAGKHALRSSNRRYTSASLAQASSSSTILPPAKPLSFGLPSLHFLSQSYSIWSTTSPTTPLPPPPSETLKDKPFTSEEGIARLLYSLARHPHAFAEIDRIVCPSLEGLLSVHNYAGARAILERVLDEIVHYPEHKLPLGRKLLHKIISTLQHTNDFHKKADWELHSAPAMRPMFSLILQYLIAYPDKFSINTLTIKTLVRIPEYLDLRSISLLLQLFDEVVRTDPQGESLSRNVRTLHNIMRVYALHGHSEAAEQWMNTILEVQEAPSAFKRLEGQSFSHADTSQAGPSTPLRKASATLKRTLSAKESALFLGTTYLSSLAQPESKGAAAPLVDSRMAMTFFQELWKPDLLEDGSPKSDDVALPPEIIELDIYAWSAIIHAAALDLNRISSQSLIDVLHALEKYPSLPKPSAVPYTAVMGGLNRRGDYQRTIDLFEHEIIPQAIRRVEHLQSEKPMSAVKQEEMVIDAQLLGAVVLAWTGLGDIGMAVNVVKWFGSRVEGDGDGASPSSQHSHATSTDHTSEKQTVAETQASFPEALRGAVKVDTILVNQLMTYLGQTARYNSVYNLFASMRELFKVYPDETTLTILARTALSAAKMKRRGLIPEFAEDVWQAGVQVAREDNTSAGSNFFSTGFAHLKNALGVRPSEEEVAREAGVWDGVQPVERVLDIYWAMLEQNFDAAHDRAVKDNMKTASAGIFSFVRPKSSTSSDTTELQAASHTASAAALDEHNVTSRLQGQDDEEHYNYRWPSLCPTSINMHMLIALSGYFGRGADIPLILSHMKQLDMKPIRRTLCLALWSYEETGVYSNEYRKFRNWLLEWLGELGVPTDEEVGAFRARQWSGSKAR